MSLEEFDGHSGTGTPTDEIVGLSNEAVSRLAATMAHRRGQADAVRETLDALKAQNAALVAEVERARAEERRLGDENARLERVFAALVASHRRLHTGFQRFILAVDEVAGEQIGIDQRIEASLLASDIGVSLGEHADVTSPRYSGVVLDASVNAH